MTALPVTAPSGTVAVTEVALHAVTAAVTPPSVIQPVDCVLPKFEPVSTTEALTAADVGVTALTIGTGTTVKAIPLLS